MSSAPDPSYDGEELFDRLYSNISSLKDTEELSHDVAETASDIEAAVEDVEETFYELEEFSDTAQEYIRWLEDLNAELGEKIDETEDPDEIDYTEIEALLDTHLTRIEGIIDDYTSDTPDPQPLKFDNYKSPTFNFGVKPEEEQRNFKSPTFNFASMPNWSSGNGSGNILSSWDDYNWEGWDTSGEPGFETPSAYAESLGFDSHERSSGNSWPSIKITYHGQDDDWGSWTGEDWASDAGFSWDGAAS